MKHVNDLLAAINEEQQRHRNIPAIDPLAPQSTPVEQQDGCERGLYDGLITFSMEQMKEIFVPTIYQLLADFPISSELGYCKV